MEVSKFKAETNLVWQSHRDGWAVVGDSERWGSGGEGGRSRRHVCKQLFLTGSQRLHCNLNVLIHPFVRSSIHSFFPQLFIEKPVCPRPCSRF